MSATLFNWLNRLHAKPCEISRLMDGPLIVVHVQIERRFLLTLLRSSENP